MFFNETDHVVNVEVIANGFDVGTDEMLPTEPQFSNGAIEGNLVDAAVRVEVVSHELFLVVVSAVFAFGLCAHSVKRK